MVNDIIALRAGDITSQCAATSVAILKRPYAATEIQIDLEPEEATRLLGAFAPVMEGLNIQLQIERRRLLAGLALMEEVLDMALTSRASQHKQRVWLAIAVQTLQQGGTPTHPRDEES